MTGPAVPTRTRTRALALVALLAVAAATVALFSGDRSPPLPAPPDRPAGLRDLWDGRATLELARQWTSASLGAPVGGAVGGARVAVVDGNWYLFNRRQLDTPCPGRATVHAMGTQVRVSHDAGRSWGAPQPVVMPAAGTPWACAATDGDPVYDAAADRWRFLFQCLGDSGDWAGCYVERRGASPLGPFAAPPSFANPVIESRTLWGAICDPGDRCGRTPGEGPIGDEGTFDVLPDGSAGWWVSFHGYDGVRGYRGLARTFSFEKGSWQVDGAGGTPRDAMLTSADAATWRESWRAGGPIGPGAASLIDEAGWTYAIAEMPDGNLNCTPGQTWDLGLLRSRTPASTTWEQYPAGNPLVYSARTSGGGGASGGSGPGCSIQYPSLFRDPGTGTTYVMFGRASADPAYDGLYVYRVAWNRNLFRNGDFWRADASGWQAWPGTATQVEVRRDPDGSPDGTPYLALDCGTPTQCAPDSSVFQDVPIAAHGGRDIAFAASLRADAGTGKVALALIQLDASGREVERTMVHADPTTTWRRFGGDATLDGDTRRLRIQLYPQSPGTVRADSIVARPR